MLKQPAKKTGLSILDRFLIASTLPTQGNFSLLATCKLLEEKIRLKPEEQKVLMKGFSQWDFAPSSEAKKEDKFDISKDELDAIKKWLESLDRDEKATPLHLSLYERLFWTTTVEQVQEQKLASEPQDTTLSA